MINLDDILKKEPTLTAMGIEGEKTFHTDEMPDINQVQTCINWLNSIKRTKTINKRSSSYGYKHEAERAYKTYVTNGAFIAAVIHLGIPYEKIPGTPNIFVALSQKR
jgi:hypothetical protein